MYGPPLSSTRMGTVMVAHPDRKHNDAPNDRQLYVGLQHLLLDRRSAERTVYRVESLASRSVIRFYSSSTTWRRMAAASHESA